ncbi:MAG: tRNA (adenosine(37)-N6)-dimethylallyltransferase MiaA [Alphaproteobacteria bacterium]|nr:tRNA (adenosine(37)-N6)-dimethylallyltransferase MiaA [Alphaproteobacteria bacterium]
MQTGKIIVIAGPTASGKSALAIDVALFVGGVVINADSMQLYKDMPVITAAPTDEDRTKADHRLFEIYDPSFKGNVVDWLKLAVGEIKSVWAEGKIPVVVGGTGLYLENLIEGTTPIPETIPEIRRQVQNFTDKEGLEALYQKVKEVDAPSALKIKPNDITRLKRALEVFLSTGKPLSEWHKLPLIRYLPEAKFFIIKICPSAQELDKRCYERFDKMVEAGAIDEVQRLYKRKLSPDLPAMKALGVPELMEFFKGKTNVYTAVQNAKLHTRQYAKRQRTWFKNRLQADFELKKCYKGQFPKEVLTLLK